VYRVPWTGSTTDAVVGSISFGLTLPHPLEGILRLSPFTAWVCGRGLPAKYRFQLGYVQNIDSIDVSSESPRRGCFLRVLLPFLYCIGLVGVNAPRENPHLKRVLVWLGVDRVVQCAVLVGADDG
jgi:hypothetical protein